MSLMDRKRELAFPESVVDLLAGTMGQPPGGFPPKVQKRILRDSKPVEGRPGRVAAAGRFRSGRRRGREAHRRAAHATATSSRTCSIRACSRSSCGTCRSTPTPACCRRRISLRPEAGRRDDVDIEQGKTLIIKFLTVGEPHADGRRTVFFELNGQPRSVSVVDRSLEAEVAAPPEGRSEQRQARAAPMPGMVVTVAVKAGDTVAKGQKLLTLEAMKMETTLYAEQEGRHRRCAGETRHPGRSGRVGGDV